MNRLVLAALAFVLPATPVLAAPPLSPFTADYVVLRNGKPLGRTTIELRENADTTWTLKTTTRGTEGLAKMAGLDVVEESTVRWQDDKPESVRYDFRQEAAFKSRKRHAEFDWKANQVSMQDGDEDATYALVPGTIDRHAVMLALASDLARGRTSHDYKVAMKDGIEDMQYASCGEAQLSVPAGRYATACLERKRAKRTSTSWFSAKTGWVPVQIEQVENKGDTITLRLASLK